MFLTQSAYPPTRVPRYLHHSIRMDAPYVYWVIKFLLFHGFQHSVTDCIVRSTRFPHVYSGWNEPRGSQGDVTRLTRPPQKKHPLLWSNNQNRGCFHCIAGQCLRAGSPKLHSVQRRTGSAVRYSPPLQGRRRPSSGRHTHRQSD